MSNLGVMVRFTLNEQSVEVQVDPTESLLDTVRNRCGITSVRETCGIGLCGACTVLVDGLPVSSCLMLSAMSDGLSITTTEGIGGNDDQLHPVQEAFLDFNAFQCSYCTPGFVLSATALLAEMPDPSIDQVRHYLAGNLCRCGSYVKIGQAVLEAARRLRGEPASEGQPVSIVESMATE